MNRRVVLATLLAAVIGVVFVGWSVSGPDPTPRTTPPTPSSEPEIRPSAIEDIVDEPAIEEIEDSSPGEPVPSGVRGIVTDAETNEPVMNARVEIVPMRAGALASGVTITNYRGEFEFLDVEPGQFELVAYRERYLPSPPAVVACRGDGDTRVELSLSRGASVMVEVIDALSQAPVPDAKVAYRPIAIPADSPVSEELCRRTTSPTPTGGSS